MSQKSSWEQPVCGSFFDNSDIVITAHVGKIRRGKMRLDEGNPVDFAALRALGICPRERS
jgi:hypothetical protein